MMRTITLCEKNVSPIYVEPVILAANTSTKVLPDQSTGPILGGASWGGGHEIAYITIQNCSATAYVYYSFSETCDNVANFNGVLPPYVQLNVPHTKPVYCFTTTASTSVSISMGKREGGE